MKIALVQKCPPKRSFNWKQYFKFDFDEVYLTPFPTDDLKAKDVVLNRDNLLATYDLIIPVGSESFKFTTKVSGGVTNYLGALIDDKFIAISNPAMLFFKPDQKIPFENAVAKINTIVEYGATIFKGNYEGIESYDRAIEVLTSILNSPIINVAIDTETTALYPRNGYILGISIANSLKEGFYISTDVVYDDVDELLSKIIDSKRVIMQNAKFDLAMLEYHFDYKFHKDIKHPLCVEDTMYMHYILDENSSHGLKDLAIKYTPLGYYDKALEDFKAQYCSSNKIKKEDFTYDLIPFDIISEYAAKDASATIALYDKFKDPIYSNKQLSWVYKNIMMRGCFYLTRMQDNGVPFSLEALKAAEVSLSQDYRDKLVKLYEFPEIHKFEEIHKVRFNPNSVYHLRTLLFDLLKLQPTGKLTGTGALSTDAEVLEELAGQHPVPDLLLGLKRLGKIISTYIIKIQLGLDKDGMLRTNFNLHTTTSGRLSSSGKLNVQQLPRDDKTVKGCIVAHPGYVIVSCDQ